jgi:hypothetical protein
LNLFVLKYFSIFFLAPTEKMRSILERTIQEAKDKISKVLLLQEENQLN